MPENSPSERPGQIRIDYINPTSKGRAVVVEITDGNCFLVKSHKLNADGYFRKGFTINGEFTFQMYHRFAWSRAGREIPEGFEIDHICRNRSCCNVDHLQLLEISEHKSKSNRERYKERISRIIGDINNGLANSEITVKQGVTTHTVNRYRRNIRNGVV